MITIISGTNRDNNQSIKVAKHYGKLLKEKNIEYKLLDLSTLPKDFIFSALYGVKNDDFENILQEYIYNSSKLVIVTPEYNGSYPGIVKAFIDGWNPKETPEKKAALVGVASGRQGNARGMDHLTNVLNYLQINVIPVKVPIGTIYGYLNENGEFTSDEINMLFNKQIDLLIA